MMKLWTFQHPDVLKLLKKNQTFKADWRRADSDFKESYKWLTRHMYLRELVSNAGFCPIWCWYAYDGKHKKPDLRTSGMYNSGEKCVCIELEIEQNKVLLSDFDKWHFVLNNWFLPSSDEVVDDNKSYSTKEMEKSWERIFISIDQVDDYLKKELWIQACIDEIELNNVIDVREFIAR